MNYNYHRYYDPRRGRYLSKDPIGLMGGVNLRGYVSGNVVGAVDVNGLQYIDPYIQKIMEDEINGAINSVKKSIRATFNNIINYISPTELNGNYQHGFKPQDNVCSLGWFGGAADSIDTVLSCCKKHDGCYTENRCNFSSWYGNFLPVDNQACQQCNSEAISCVF